MRIGLGEGQGNGGGKGAGTENGKGKKQQGTRQKIIHTTDRQSLARPQARTGYTILLKFIGLSSFDRLIIVIWTVDQNTKDRQRIVSANIFLI